MDKDFVAATIQAIGRCATNIGRVRDTCLNGLVQLLSNRDGQCLSVCMSSSDDLWVLPACLTDGQQVFSCLASDNSCSSVHQPQFVSLYPCLSEGEVQEVEERSQGPGGIAGVSAHCVWPSDCPGLISCSTELVVAESVVVIKKLLQMQPAQHGEIIKHLAKLTDNIQVRG